LPAATLWDVEGPKDGGSVEEVREHLVDLWILLAMVGFGILFGTPEAERPDTIRFGVRRQHDFVHESGLFLHNRQHLVIEPFAHMVMISVASPFAVA
jgi:hypothetical protein